MRWEAALPGIEASISTLQCKFPSFSAKFVNLSINLPTELEPYASKDYYSIVKAYSLLFVGSNPITYTTFFTSVNSA